MLSDRFKIAATAQSALRRMKGDNVTENVMRPKVDHSKMLFEEYDDNSFSQKVKIDSVFYKTMLSNLDESYADSVKTILTSMFCTTKEIYEHINIKPRVYGFNMTTAFNESDDVLQQNAQRMINDFINNKYYSLTTEQREEKYYPAVRSIAKDVILSESVDEKEAITFATKAVVMKELIERINFPMSIQNKIQELLIDENYGKIFNQEHLSNLWDQFQEQNFDIAKIVAVLI